MTRTLLLAAALLVGPTLSSCGDDDDGGAVASGCDLELVDVARVEDADFRVRIRNTGSATGQLSVQVSYFVGDTQLSSGGIDVASNVAPGTVAEFTTVGGFAVDTFTCARLFVTFIGNNATSIPCSDEPIGDDCYN